MPVYKGFVAGSQVGPPTLIALIRRWFHENPILSGHIVIVTYGEGIYFETDCLDDDGTNKEVALAFVPSEGEPDRRVLLFNPIIGAPGSRWKPKTLKIEDPDFFKKFRRGLILRHNKVCQIKK